MKTLTLSMLLLTALTYWGQDKFILLNILYSAAPFLVPAVAAVLASVYFINHQNVILIAGAGLLVSLLIIVNAWFFAPRAAQANADEKTITALTLNMWVGNRQLDELAQFITNQNADVVTLQEMHPNNVEQFAALYPHVQYMPKFFSFGNKNYFERGLLTLSKFPLTGRVQLQEDVSALAYNIATPYGEITVVNVHTDAPVSQRRLSRNEATIKSLTTIKTANPLLIMGDFNAVPFTRGMLNLKTQLNLSEGLNPILPTWPLSAAVAGLPQIPAVPLFALDHVLTTPQLSAKSTRLRAPGADHMALVSAIRFVKVSN